MEKPLDVGDNDDDWGAAPPSLLLLVIVADVYRDLRGGKSDAIAGAPPPDEVPKINHMKKVLGVQRSAFMVSVRLSVRPSVRPSALFVEVD